MPGWAPSKRKESDTTDRNLAEEKLNPPPAPKFNYLDEDFRRLEEMLPSERKPFFDADFTQFGLRRNYTPEFEDVLSEPWESKPVPKPYAGQVGTDRVSLISSNPSVPLLRHRKCDTECQMPKPLQPSVFAAYKEFVPSKPSSDSPSQSVKHKTSTSDSQKIEHKPFTCSSRGDKDKTSTSNSQNVKEQNFMRDFLNVEEEASTCKSKNVEEQTLTCEFKDIEKKTSTCESKNVEYKNTMSDVTTSPCNSSNKQLVEEDVWKTKKTVEYCYPCFSEQGVNDSKRLSEKFVTDVFTSSQKMPVEKVDAKKKKSKEKEVSNYYCKLILKQKEVKDFGTIYCLKKPFRCLLCCKTLIADLNNIVKEGTVIKGKTFLYIYI